jgi:hypothetical protein
VPVQAKSSAAKSWLAKVAQQQKTTLAKPGGANKFPELQMALAMVRPAWTISFDIPHRLWGI